MTKYQKIKFNGTVKDSHRLELGQIVEEKGPELTSSDKHTKIIIFRAAINEDNPKTSREELLQLKI